MKMNQDKEKERVIEQILCENYNSYYRMAMRITQNAQDAADVVQEGAYKAIKNCASLRQIEYAKTWIYKIMLNEAYRIMKDCGRVIPDQEFLLDEAESSDAYERVELVDLLETIAPKDRLVIEFKYFEDMTLEQIAEILDENVNTIKSRLYRGLKKLRVNMED